MKTMNGFHLVKYILVYHSANDLNIENCAVLYTFNPLHLPINTLLLDGLYTIVLPYIFCERALRLSKMREKIHYS